jgi:hypothetical protein
LEEEVPSIGFWAQELVLLAGNGNGHGPKVVTARYGEEVGIILEVQPEGRVLRIEFPPLLYLGRVGLIGF